MHASALIRQFSEKKELPVDIEADVIAALRSMGVTDEIYPFWDIHLNIGTLQGYCHREEIPRGESSYFMTTIGYAKNGHEMERLVTCKELLHILDPKKCRVDTGEKVYSFIAKIVLRGDLVDPFSDDDDQADRVAAIEALAILFPLAARNELLPFYKSGEITLAQISELAELPQSYVKIVLSDSWPRIHDILLRGREHREQDHEE